MVGVQRYLIKWKTKEKMVYKRDLPREPFPLLITTKGNCWYITTGDRKRGKIAGRVETSRLLKPKAKILWQLENLQNYKDFYGKQL